MVELLRLQKDEVESGHIKVNEERIDNLGLDEEDLCKVTFPTTMSTALVRIEIDNDVDPEDFLCNEKLAFHFGIEEGFECEIEAYEKEIKELDSLSLKMDTLGDKDVDVNSYITGEKDKVTERLNGHHVNKNSKIPLSDLGIYIEVESTEPSLASDEFAEFKEDIHVQMSKKYKNYFNGILLVDSSKSMASERKEDMMKPLENDAFLEDLSSNERVKDYISRKIKEEERITKLDAAILAILAFLSAKVSRGRGEGISVILWSEDAIPLNFVIEGEKKIWVSSGEIEDKDSLAELIASELLAEAEKVKSGQTNMEKAIKEAGKIRDGIVEEQEEELGNAYPTMVIFLTDGKRTAGRSPVSVVKNEIAPLDKTVLHTIGLGDDVDEDGMISMAKATGGKYFNTRDVKDLIQFYDTEASEFTSTKIQEEQEDKDMGDVFDKLSDLKG